MLICHPALPLDFPCASSPPASSRLQYPAANTSLPPTTAGYDRFRTVLFPLLMAGTESVRLYLQAFLGRGQHLMPPFGIQAGFMEMTLNLLLFMSIASKKYK